MSTAALVGCGDVAVVHIEAMRELGITLLAVVDDAPAGRARAAAMAPGVSCLSSVDALIEAVEAGELAMPDVVHVTTPHHQHADVTIPLLHKGFNILQEKPLANTLAGGEALVEAAARATGKIGICFQNRYNATSRALKEMLDDGLLGEVTGAYASCVWSRTPDYYQARPWRGSWRTAGGGLLINQAIHTLDLLQWLLGEPVATSGRAATLKYGDVIEVEDTATAMFTHPGGITSTFVGSLTNTVHRPVELEVYGTRGAATLRGDLHVTLADGSTREVAERVVASSGRSYWGLSHQLLIDDLHQSLEEPEPFWIGPGQAMASLRMLKAVYAQTWPGRHETQ